MYQRSGSDLYSSGISLTFKAVCWPKGFGNLEAFLLAIFVKLFPCRSPLLVSKSLVFSLFSEYEVCGQCEVTGQCRHQMSILGSVTLWCQLKNFKENWVMSSLTCIFPCFLNPKSIWDRSTRLFFSFVLHLKALPNTVAVRQHINGLFWGLQKSLLWFSQALYPESVPGDAAIQVRFSSVFQMI